MPTSNYCFKQAQCAVVCNVCTDLKGLNMQAVRGNATYVAGVVMAISGDTQGELLKEKIEKIEKYWSEKDFI
jgi:hypothetical protein